MVGKEGLEPSRISPLEPKSSAYTNFATRPNSSGEVTFWASGQAVRSFKAGLFWRSVLATSLTALEA